MEDSENEGDTDNDGFDFDENIVERELAAGTARLDIARQHIRDQELLHKCIQSHLAEQAVDHGLQIVDFEPALGIGSPSQSDAAAYESQERMVNARLMAEEFGKRQARMDQFQRSKMMTDAREKQHHEKLVRAQKISDRQAVRRQREKLAEQREKIFHQQQRRGEQQKMLKEIQRDQERNLHLLQLKHKASLRPLPPLKKAGAPKLLGSSSSAPVVGGEPTPLNVANEQIFKDLRVSHEKYNKQIETWEKRAADNERRTEAHRKKMLLGGSTRSKEQNKALFKKVVRNLTTFQGFVKRTSLSNIEGVEARRPSADHAPVLLEDVKEHEPPEDLPASPTSMGSDSRPSTTAARWRAKREEVKLFQRDQVEQARQKLERDQERMERIRQGGQEKTEERRKAASTLITAWEEKSDTAAKRREAKGALDDQIFHMKEQEWLMNRSQTLQRINSERATAFQSRSDDIKDVVSKGAKILNDSRNMIKEKFHQYDEQTKTFLEQKQGGSGGSYTGEKVNPMERAQVYKERKAGQEKEFRKKANDEINKKAARLKDVLQVVRKPPSPLDARNWEGLEAHRRKPKYGASRPAGTPTGPLSLLKDVPTAPSTAELDVAAEAAKALPLEPDSPTFETPTGEKDIEQWSQVLQRRKSLTRSPTSPAIMFAQKAEESEAPSRQLSSGHESAGHQDDAGSSANSGENPFAERDEHGEKEFLNDLQAWSHQELRRIRRNSLDSNPGFE